MKKRATCPAPAVKIAGDEAFVVGEERHHWSDQCRVETVKEGAHDFFGLRRCVAAALVGVGRCRCSRLETSRGIGPVSVVRRRQACKQFEAVF